MTNLVKQFDIGISDLNCEKVEALFGFSPRLGVRDTVATAAFRILRSFLSSATNARKLIADRELVFAAAMARKPEFYKPFYRFCKHLGSWNHACRFYRLTRQAFRFEGVPESVINASQKIVMDRHRDIPAFLWFVMIGITLPENFHRPFAADDIDDSPAAIIENVVSVTNGRQAGDDSS